MKYRKKKEGKAMKRYLVACYDQNDVITNLQKMYLKMKLDFGERVSYNAKEMKIVSNHFTIYFLRQREIKYVKGIEFFGSKKTKIFNRFANSQEQLAYKEILETVRTKYSRNDSDGILAMYAKECV